jgi:hypothetical protein
MVALRKSAELPPRRQSAVKRELYRELCKDEGGNRYTVIVWRDFPGTSLTSYTLEDGTPVHYEDECYFLIEPTRQMLTRCDN